MRGSDPVVHCRVPSPAVPRLCQVQVVGLERQPVSVGQRLQPGGCGSEVPAQPEHVAVAGPAAPTRAAPPATGRRRGGRGSTVRPSASASSASTARRFVTAHLDRGPVDERPQRSEELDHLDRRVSTCSTAMNAHLPSTSMPDIRAPCRGGPVGTVSTVEGACESAVKATASRTLGVSDRHAPAGQGKETLDMDQQQGDRSSSVGSRATWQRPRPQARWWSGTGSAYYHALAERLGDPGAARRAHRISHALPHRVAARARPPAGTSPTTRRPVSVSSDRGAGVLAWPTRTAPTCRRRSWSRTGHACGPNHSLHRSIPHRCRLRLA